MHKIKGPPSANDYPDRWIDCQLALYKRFNEVMALNDDGESIVRMIADGVQAVWSLEEVETALRAFVDSEQAIRDGR